MKKLSILFMSLVAMATTVTSCSNDDDNNTPPPAAVTALELIVKDEADALVVGANVQLLDSQGAEVGAAVKTDANGKVKFSNIAAGNYFYTVQTDTNASCRTNFVQGEEGIIFISNQESFTGTVVADKTTTKNVVVYPSGLVTIGKTIAFSYNVYMVGGTQDVLIGDLSPTADLSFTMFTESAFSLKYVKLINGTESTDPADTELVDVAADQVTACGTLNLTK